jgi:hypothetical protein
VAPLTEFLTKFDHVVKAQCRRGRDPMILTFSALPPTPGSNREPRSLVRRNKSG